MVQQAVSQTTLLVVVSLLALMLAVSSAVPLDTVEDADEDMKRSVQWSRLLDRLNARRAFTDERDMGDLFARAYAPKKRYGPAMQSRSGGMSLCLWKVCPAAPWLVTKRESSNSY